SALGVTQGYSTASVDMTSKTFVATQVSGSFLLMPQADPSPQLLMIIGSNPVVSHGHTSPFPDPVNRIRRIAPTGEGSGVGPRTTETASLATRHLRIRPGTDHQLLGFLVRDALANRELDSESLGERAMGVDVLGSAVAGFDAATVSAATGVEEVLLLELAD